MPPLAFSTLACPDWSLVEVVERCRGYGYDGVEVRQIAGQTDLLQVGELAASRHAELRRALRQAGVSICGLASSVRFDYPEAAARRSSCARGGRTSSWPPLWALASCASSATFCRRRIPARGGQPSTRSRRNSIGWASLQHCTTSTFS
jgi:hypothetical protein